MSKPHTAEQHEHKNPFQSLPLCMDAKVIDMVKKGVLVVPQSKVQGLPAAVQWKMKEQLVKEKSTSGKAQCIDDIQVIDEIPQDGYGQKFQALRNTSSYSSPGTSGVSTRVAKEMQVWYNILDKKLTLKESMQ